MTSLQDKELEQEVYYHLNEDTRTAQANIGVEVRDYKATLSGYVPSLNVKDVASSLTRHVKQLKKVTNNLTISVPQNFEIPSDQMIVENIRRLINLDPEMFLEPIDIQCTNGNLVLKGTVTTYHKKMRLFEMVSNMGGVNSFLNEITVVPINSISDKELSQRLLDKIMKYRIVSPNQITIEVSNGHVILSGLAPNLRIFDSIEDIVRYSDGVVGVENKMSFS